MQLNTTSRSIGNALIVDCRGRIVVGDETALLNHQVRDLINDHPRIVLNLADVSYIDSTGLGTLVGLYSAASKAGGEVKLAGLMGKVKDLLQITKLLTVFDTSETVEEAVARFTSAPVIPIAT